jgi:hypothetical protein
MSKIAPSSPFNTTNSALSLSSYLHEEGNILWVGRIFEADMNPPLITPKQRDVLVLCVNSQKIAFGSEFMPIGGPISDDLYLIFKNQSLKYRKN